MEGAHHSPAGRRRESMIGCAILECLIRPFGRNDLRINIQHKITRDSLRGASLKLGAGKIIRQRD